MITDKETNFVFFSNLLTQVAEYVPFWQRLEPILQKNGIKYNLLEKTKDIWCRDYMPIQVVQDRFVQFRYFPDYLNSKKWEHKRSTPEEVTGSIDLGDIKNSDLNIDGGNIVKGKNKIVLTDKVFKENRKHSKDAVKRMLKETLGVKEVFIINLQPYDYLGHSDGMVRFLNDNTLLVADYSFEKRYWKAKYDQSIKNTKLQIIPFPAVFTEEKNKNGDYSAKGCYINFARIGNNILFPQFDLPEDLSTLEKTKDLFPDCKVIPINCNEIAEDGGVLNCISWNIKLK